MKSQETIIVEFFKRKKIIFFVTVRRKRWSKRFFLYISDENAISTRFIYSHRRRGTSSPMLPVFTQKKKWEKKKILIFMGRNFMRQLKVLAFSSINLKNEKKKHSCGKGNYPYVHTILKLHESSASLVCYFFSLLLSLFPKRNRFSVFT